MKHDFEVTISLDIRCYECGDDLECEVDSHGDVEVRPCKTCLGAEKDQAEQNGYEEGFADAVAESPRKGGD